MKKIPKVTKIATTINQVTIVTYLIEGHEEELKDMTPQEACVKAVKKVYSTQGEFYEDRFGISNDVAKLVIWHPEDKDFKGGPNGCDGWTNFITAKGAVVKKVAMSKLDPQVELLPPEMRKYSE